MKEMIYKERDDSLTWFIILIIGLAAFVFISFIRFYLSIKA